MVDHMELGQQLTVQGGIYRIPQTALHHAPVHRLKIEQGAKVATLTMFPENKIGSMADAAIKIPGETEKVKGAGKKSVQASGSAFEELSWITYDAMVMDLMKITNQSNEDLFKRHANME